MHKDPFQLDRLAEELVNRESAHSKESDRTDVYDLPEYTPLTQHNPYLVADDFDVEKFLLSRSHTSLPDLRTELREHLYNLKEELVKLINDDYEAFISLSTDLKDEGERLNKIKFPLDGLKVQVLQSQNELRIIQDAIQKSLEKQAVLREEKALLHLLLKLSESLARLESLLLIASPEEAAAELTKGIELRMSMNITTTDSAEDKSRNNMAKHLGRVAAEYIQLLYHASKARAERCEFVDKIQWRIDRIQSTISSDLDHVFTATLIKLTNRKGDGKAMETEKSRWISDLTECLKTYDVLRLWKDAEEILKQELVRDFVKKTIHPGALVAPHSPLIPHTPFPPVNTLSSSNTLLPPQTPYSPLAALSSAKPNAVHSFGSSSFSPYVHLLEGIDDPLAMLYSQILRFLERDLRGIMEIAEHIAVKSLSYSRYAEGDESPNGNGFELLANVVWEEFGNAIIRELGGIIFSSGRPNEFKRHYEISQAFLRSLESLAPSLRSIEAMRCHPVFVSFEQRWQLPVYFQMRWKEIVGGLEDQLATPRADPSFVREKNAFATSQAASAWVAITACWSAETLIPELCDKFWKLTLQILSRFKIWLEQGLHKAELSLTRSTGQGSDKAISSPSHSRSVTPVAVSGVPLPEHTIAEDTILREYVATVIDIQAMRTNVSTLWREEISMMFPDGTDHDAVTDALQHMMSELASLIPLISNRIVSILTKRCSDALLPVRSIPSQFRAMSNKHTPSEPSYFVASILRPLKEFFGIGITEALGLPLSNDFLTLVTTEVFDNVSERYVCYLSAMKKTEESLRRLKKGKKPPFSLFGGSNSGKDEDWRDEERIRTQMILDVEAFGKDAGSLGVILESSENFKALKDIVYAAESMHPTVSVLIRLTGDIVPEP